MRPRRYSAVMNIVPTDRDDQSRERTHEVV